MSSQQGDTPLMMATKKEMVDTVKLLLDRGANISSRDQVNNLIKNALNPRIRCNIFDNEHNVQTYNGCL